MTCGGGGRPRRRVAPERRLPPNPDVPDGVELVYLGGRVERIRGTGSGLRYHVGPTARFVHVDPRDLEEVVSRPDFMRR